MGRHGRNVTPSAHTLAAYAELIDSGDAGHAFWSGVEPYDPDRLPGWVRAQQAELRLSDDERWALSTYTRGGFWIFARWAQAGRPLPADPRDRMLVEFMAKIFARDAARLGEEGTVWRGIVSEAPLFDQVRPGDIIDIGTGNYSSSSLNPYVAALFSAEGMRELTHPRRHHYLLRVTLPATVRAVCLIGHTSYDAARDRAFGEVLLRPAARAVVVHPPFVATARDYGVPFVCVHARVIAEDPPILPRRRYLAGQ
jgi:hypothetical protein